MKTSGRALAAMQPKEMPEREQPLSEKLRLVGLEWSKADATAKLMEQLKSSTLAKMQNRIEAQHGKMSEAKLNRIVLASDEWVAYITDMVNLRKVANDLKAEMAFIEEVKWERNDANATARAEMRMR
jgi:hypothetical protein